MQRKQVGSVFLSESAPVEPVDQLLFDLQHALERKRIDSANMSTAVYPQMFPSARTLRAEALYRDEQVLNRQLCQALQEIADACRPGASLFPPDTVAALGHLARAALEIAQHHAGSRRPERDSL